MLKKEVIVSACWSLWPIPPTVMTILAAPGFILPFFNNPIGRLLTVTAGVWMLLGFYVMYKCRKWWQRLILTFIFPLPVLLTPMLGPAVVTIINAFGPIMQSK
jgi:hypothetical protein